MVNYDQLRRFAIEQNPQETRYILDKLCEINITFESEVFEYRGANDFIFYGYQGDEISFAIKGLCSELYIKFVSIYYKNQADLFLGLYNLRLMAIKNAEVQIEQGKTLTFIWSKEICSKTVENYAKLTNTVDSDNFEHKITKTNKDVYFGKNIEIEETSKTNSSAPLFATNTNLPFTAAKTSFPSTNDKSVFPSIDTTTNNNSVFQSTNPAFSQNKGFGNTKGFFNPFK